MFILSSINIIFWSELFFISSLGNWFSINSIFFFNSFITWIILLLYSLKIFSFSFILSLFLWIIFFIPSISPFKFFIFSPVLNESSSFFLFFSSYNSNFLNILFSKVLSKALFISILPPLSDSPFKISYILKSSTLILTLSKSSLNLNNFWVISSMFWSYWTILLLIFLILSLFVSIEEEISLFVFLSNISIFFSKSITFLYNFDINSVSNFI